MFVSFCLLWAWSQFASTVRPVAFRFCVCVCVCWIHSFLRFPQIFLSITKSETVKAKIRRGSHAILKKKSNSNSFCSQDKCLKALLWILFCCDAVMFVYLLLYSFPPFKFFPSCIVSCIHISQLHRNHSVLALKSKAVDMRQMTRMKLILPAKPRIACWSVESVTWTVIKLLVNESLSCACLRLVSLAFDDSLLVLPAYGVVLFKNFFKAFRDLKNPVSCLINFVV